MGRGVLPRLAAILVVADAIGLWVAYKFAGMARVALNRVFALDFTGDQVSTLFPPALLVAACWGVALGMTGAYDLLGKRSLPEVARETLKAVTLAMCLQVVAMFFVTRVMYSRSLVLLFWMVSFVALLATRQLAIAVLRRFKPRALAETVAVIGTGPTARLLADKIAGDRELRFRFAGFMADDLSSPEELARLAPAVIGHVEKAEELINQYRLSRLFASNVSRDRTGADLVLLCDRMDISLERVPDLLGIIAERVRVTELDGMPLLSFAPVGFSRWQDVVKRSVDLVVAAAGLVALAPLLGLVAVAVRLDSPGPVLFRQARAGRGGRHFQLLKFRSMQHGAERQRAELTHRNEAEGHLFKIREDPRVTRVGRLLRRYSIDELPQLFNVVSGEMSLVGPRPLPADDLHTPASPYAHWYTRRRGVRPGITGLWQVSGRSQLPFEEMVNLDLHYINNWSLMLDLQILLRTLPVVIRGRGAY